MLYIDDIQGLFNIFQFTRTAQKQHWKNRPVVRQTTTDRIFTTLDSIQFFHFIY